MIEFNTCLDQINASSSMQRGAIKGKEIINLAIGTPDINPPSQVISLLNEFSENPRFGYGNSKGGEKARGNIIKLTSNNEEWIDPNINVSLVPGAKYGIYLSLKTISNPGDSVTLIQPYWLSYPDICASLGLRVNYFNFKKEKFNAAELITALEKKKSKILIINSPNNPSGEIYNSQEINSILEYCEKKQIWVILDEVYKDLIFNSSNTFDQNQEFNNLIRVGSFSKSLAIPGFRIGYVIGSRKFISNFNLLNQHITTSCNSLSEFIIERLEQKKFQEFVKFSSKIYKKRYSALKKALPSEYRLYASESTFYALIDVGRKFESGKVAVQEFEKKGIIVTDGINYGTNFSKSIRVCLTISENRISEIINRI